MSANINQILGSLKKVISQENQSLRNGNLRALNETLVLKQTLLLDLDSQLYQMPREHRDNRLRLEMEKLGYMLKDNERLMKSAMNSVRFAYKQIAALKTRQSKVGAYDRYGKTLHIPETRNGQFKLV